MANKGHSVGHFICTSRLLFCFICLHYLNVADIVNVFTCLQFVTQMVTRKMIMYSNQTWSSLTYWTCWSPIYTPQGTPTSDEAHWLPGFYWWTRWRGCYWLEYKGLMSPAAGLQSSGWRCRSKHTANCRPQICLTKWNTNKCFEWIQDSKLHLKNNYALIYT